MKHYFIRKPTFKANTALIKYILLSVVELLNIRENQPFPIIKKTQVLLMIKFPA